MDSVRGASLGGDVVSVGSVRSEGPGVVVAVVEVGGAEGVCEAVACDWAGAAEDMVEVEYGRGPREKRRGGKQLRFCDPC